MNNDLASTRPSTVNTTRPFTPANNEIKPKRMPKH